MPRPKTQAVYGLPGSTLDERRARLQPEIDALLAAANAGNENVDAVLVAITEGKRRFRGGWPA